MATVAAKSSTTSSSFGLRAQPAASGGRNERLERERLAGFERRNNNNMMTPMPQQRQQIPVRPPVPAARQPPRPPPPSSAPPPAAMKVPAPNNTAMEALTQVLVNRIGEEIRPLRSALDAITLRCSGLENETKSLKNSLSALRDEISGISQATGGASTAQKATEVGDSLRALQKAFGEFSAKKDNEALEHERRIVAAQTSAEALAQQAYERSISVNSVVIAPDGVDMKPYNKFLEAESIKVPNGTSLVLRYPMQEYQVDGKSVICMLHTIVSAEGDVREYSVPVQVDGLRTVSFHETFTF